MTFNRTITAFVLSSVMLAAALVLSPMSAAQMPSSKNGVELQWANLETAVSTGADQKKPIMVDIYTDWCGWCKKMDREVFNDSAVSKVLISQFILAKVNAESRESLTFKGQKTNGIGIAGAFGVTGYPSIIFLDSNGEMLTMIPGFLDAETFLPILMFIGHREYEKMGWDAYLADYKASKKVSPKPR